MITEKAIPYWPEEISLTDDGIRDEATNHVSPINKTGAWIASQVDGKRTMMQIGDLVSQQYGLSQDDAKSHTFSFLVQLNRAYLLNFLTSFSLKTILLAPLFFVFSIQTNLLESIESWMRVDPWQRIKIDLNKPAAIAHFFWKMTQAILSKYIVIWILLMTIVVVLSMFWYEINEQPIIYISIFAIAAIFTFGAVLGFSLHETGHALAFIKYSQTENSPFLVIRNMVVAVVCPISPPRTQLIIAAAGPMSNLFYGLILALIGWLLPDNIGNYVISFSAGIMVGAFSILPFFSDGKHIFSGIWQLLMNKTPTNGPK